MKNTIKFAVLGACALAASSSVALASEMPQGITTGLALGAPLPEGFYDISIASYGTRTGPDATGTSLAYAIPVWLIWSTPWQIAGGRVQLSTATGVADTWATGATGSDSWLNTFIDGGIKWNLGNGWNFGWTAGVFLPSTQPLPIMLGRNYAAFQGLASVSYLANGWNLTATGIYGSGGHDVIDQTQNPWVNLDLTATRKFGKFEVGSIAYGSWEVGCAVSGCNKFAQFAMGGLVGYDFGSFIAQGKLGTDVWVDSNTRQNAGFETRGWLTIIKPLWNPEPAPMK